MKFELPAYGIIKKINNNRPSIISLTDYDILVSFDPFTKIEGCNFNHLERGDKVLVNELYEKSEGKRNYFMCKYISLLNVEKKWNKILKKDKKYSIDHRLSSSPYFTRPEIIEPSVYQVKEIPITNDMTSRDKTIISLHNQGKSGKYISKIVKLTKQHVNRIIKGYKDNKGN